MFYPWKRFFRVYRMLFLKTCLQSVSYHVPDSFQNLIILPNLMLVIFSWSSTLVSLSEANNWKTTKNGECRAFFGHLWHCSLTLPVKKSFFVFRGNFLLSLLFPLPLVLSLGTTGKILVQTLIYLLNQAPMAKETKALLPKLAPQHSDCWFQDQCLPSDTLFPQQRTEGNTTCTPMPMAVTA